MSRSPLHRWIAPFTAAAMGTAALAAATAQAAPAVPLAVAAGATAAAADTAAPTAQLMADLDVLYIPPLFLTGQAPKSAEGPRKAMAALQRLQDAWPALSTRLAAVWPADRAWARTVQSVAGHITQARRDADAGRWAESHEALEHVRLELMAARAARGLPHLLDLYTRFHEPMEELANWGESTTASATPAQLEAWYAQARAQWLAIERQSEPPALYHLSPARLAQWRKAVADEGAALSALSDALRAGDTARLRQAAAAIKTPFVRAYAAFGLGEGERLSRAAPDARVAAGAAVATGAARRPA